MRTAIVALLLVFASSTPALAQTPTPTPEESEEKWWKDEAEPTPAPPVAVPAPTPGPMVGVLVRTTAGGTVSDKAIEAGVRESGHRVLEGGAARAYLAFQPPGMSFDDAQCRELRDQLRVDRLLVVEARGQKSGAVAVRMRAFDPEGRVTSKFLEASPATVDAAIVAVFGELPPVREPAKTRGIGSSLGPVVSPPRSEVDTVDVHSIGITPIAVFQPHPPYPAEAVAKALTGAVRLEIVVDTSGKVASVRPVAGEPPFLEPAIATVERWRYQPLIVNGQPIIWKSTVNLKFRLDRSLPGMTNRKPPASWRPPVFGESGTREIVVMAGRSTGSSSTSLASEADASSRDELGRTQVTAVSA